MRSAILAVFIAIAGGCATAPVTKEQHRELVLEYVGHDVGTTGPFSKKGMRELDILSEKDRQEAAAMLERGALGFVIIEPNPNLPNRIVLVAGKRVIGDFPATRK